MPTREELLEEDRKLRRLRIIVDMTQSMILQQPINYEEAYELVRFVKREALQLFPGKENAFDIIYRPRFNRLLNEKFGYRLATNLHE